MQGSPQQRQTDDESVRHLLELGYVDPAGVIARENALRRQLASDLQRAVQLRREGRNDEATTALETLIREDPDWVPPRLHLAELYYALGRVSQAQEQIDWLTYHGVEHPKITLIGAALALMRRALPAAVDALEYVRFVEPKLTGVQSLGGVALLRLGRLDEAADAFQQALEQDSTDGRALEGLAGISLARGDFEKAADYALQALELNLRSWRAHYRLGIALAGLARIPEAIHALEASARAAPASAAPYYWLARVAEEQLQDQSRAAEYRRKAREVIRNRKQSARSTLTQ